MLSNETWLLALFGILRLYLRFTPNARLRTGPLPGESALSPKEPYVQDMLFNGEGVIKIRKSPF